MGKRTIADTQTLALTTENTLPVLPARMLPTVARLLLLLTSSSIWSNRCRDLSNLFDGYGGDVSL